MQRSIAQQSATLLACAAICRRYLHRDPDAARTGHAACIDGLRALRAGGGIHPGYGFAYRYLTQAGA